MQFWQVYRKMARCLHSLYKWYVFYVCIERHVCTAKTQLLLLNVWDIYYNIEWFPVFNVADYCILRTLVNLPRWCLQKWWKMLIINNMWWNIFYTYAFVDFITYKLVDGCSTNGSTATFIAGVSTNVCRIIGVLVLWMANRWQYLFVSHRISVSF
jgi:hypothetical protein